MATQHLPLFDQRFELTNGPKPGPIEDRSGGAACPRSPDRLRQGRLRLAPLVRPLDDRVNHGGERAPLLRQRVLHPDGRLGDHRTLHDAFRLELLQAVAEHAIGDLGNRGAQHGKATPRLQQDEDDGSGPAATDELARAVEACAKRWRSGHGFHTGLAGTAGFFESLGFRPGRVFATAAAVSEVGSGLLLALGLLEPFAAAVMLSVMIVAAASVHWQHGLFAMSNGIEVPLLYAVSAAALALTGPGAYSLDAVLGLTLLWTPGVVVTALALGIAGGIGNLALRRTGAVEAAA